MYEFAATSSVERPQPMTNVQPTNPPYFSNTAEGQKKMAPGCLCQRLRLGVGSCDTTTERVFDVEVTYQESIASIPYECLSYSHIGPSGEASSR
jgi:hypothetical protein